MADRQISEKTRAFIASGYQQPIDAAALRSRRRRAYDVARFVLSVLAMSLAIAFTFTLSPMLLAAGAAMMLGLFIVDGIGFVWFTAKPWVMRLSKGDKPETETDDDIAVHTTDTIRTLAMRWLRKRFSWRWLISTGLTVAFVVCTFQNIGAFVLQDDAMKPTLDAGEMVVFSKRVVTSQMARGDWIIFRFDDDTTVGQANQPTVGRIVALPGDTLAIAENRFVVNGNLAGQVGITGDQRQVFTVPAAPKGPGRPGEPGGMVVPEGCWFVVCEQGGTRFDGRLIGWARGDRILGVRMVIFSRNRLGIRLDDAADEL